MGQSTAEIKRPSTGKTSGVSFGVESEFQAVSDLTACRMLIRDWCSLLEG